MNQFDDETAVRQIGGELWAAHVSPAWNIGDNPNGGYLISIALNAVLQSVPHPDPVSLTTHFLRPGVPGEDCEISVDVIRSGRTLSTARASLAQDGKVRLEILAALSDLDQPAGVDTELAVAVPDLPAPEDCPQRSEQTQGIHLPILGRLDTRLHPGQAIPGASDRAEISGYIRFADGREPEARALPLFTDAFPPSPLSLLGTIGWVPTLELTVHVRRRPAPGWIRARFQAQDLHEGRMIESGALWDSNGALVAQSRQLGLVTRRNT